VPQLQLQQVAPLGRQPALEVQQRDDVRVALGDDEVVAVEHLGEQEGGEVELEAAVAPAPLPDAGDGRRGGRAAAGDGVEGDLLAERVAGEDVLRLEEAGEGAAGGDG